MKLIKKIVAILLFIIGIPMGITGIYQIIKPGDFFIDLITFFIFGFLPCFWGLKLYKSSKKSKKNKKLNEFSISTSNIIDFYVLDVETANESNDSICQIGVAAFNENGLVDSWCFYINPESNFDPRNIDIHGIRYKDVMNSPKFPDIYNILVEIENKIVIQHTGFDRSSINNSCKKYDLNNLNFLWLDSASIAKRTWKEVSRKGYGLSDLAKRFNIKFNHHDAVEDAITTGKIVLLALSKTNTSINEWVNLTKKPLSYFYDNEVIYNHTINSKNSSKKDPKQILKSKSNLPSDKIDSFTDKEAWENVYKYEKIKKQKELKLEICFSGFNIDHREYLESKATGNNFKVVKSVTKNLNFLVCGENVGPSKLEKAKSQNVTILNEDQFSKMLVSKELIH